MTRFHRSTLGLFSPILLIPLIVIFAIYTGLLIYYTPHNVFLGIGLYVLGTTTSTIPTILPHPTAVIVGYLVTAIVLALFLAVVFVWHL